MYQYVSYANCGFCKHFGQVSISYESDVCAECEVRLIRQYLEEFLSKIKGRGEFNYRKHDEDKQV